MKPMSLNLSKMKKIGGDKNSSTFLHPAGHKMVIAHNGVSALQKKQLEMMPVQKMAEGGEANSSSVDDTADSAPPVQEHPSQWKQFLSQATGGQYGEAATPQQLEETKSKVGAVLSDQGQQFSDQALGANSRDMMDNPAPASNDSAVGPSSASVDQPAASNTAVKMSAGAGGVDLNKAYAKGQNAIYEQQKVASDLSKADAEIQSKAIADKQALAESLKKNTDGFLQQQQHFLNDYANEHINPNHYVENMSVPKKIFSAIGMLLGGAGAGPNQPNPGMEFLQKQIDRDIQGQQSRMDQQKTILGANQSIFHDNLIAQNQTRMNMNDIYGHQIQLAASKLGTQQAKAQADAASSHFAMENAQLLQQNALRATALGAVKNGQGDPARLVTILVPKDHQAKAFGEIEAAENTKKMSADILKNFEDAAKENTVLRTGGGLLRTPGSVYALHQAMQPTFKDLEGTVRQAAMDNTFKNITPMPGDADYKIQQKREALQGYLQSKLSAPTARGYGIDLRNFESTSPMATQKMQEPIKMVDNKTGKIWLADPTTKQFKGWAQ